MFLFYSLAWVICGAHVHMSNTEALKLRYCFNHCLVLWLSSGPVRHRSDSLKCSTSSHRLQVFPRIAFPVVFCPLTTTSGETWNFATCNYLCTRLHSFSLIWRWKAAATQKAFWFRMADRCLWNKETSRQERHHRVMQSLRRLWWGTSSWERAPNIIKCFFFSMEMAIESLSFFGNEELNGMCKEKW